MSIKNLKPNKHGRYKQGYFDVSASTKYRGPEPVIYRSGLELRAFNMFENADDIVAWESEPTHIEINYLWEGKMHKYYIDAMMEKKDSSIWLVEIKPWAQVQKNHPYFPKIEAKLRAAYEYCKDHKYELLVLTERFFKQ